MDFSVKIVKMNFDDVSSKIFLRSIHVTSRNFVLLPKFYRRASGDRCVGFLVKQTSKELVRTPTAVDSTRGGALDTSKRASDATFPQCPDLTIRSGRVSRFEAKKKKNKKK